MKRVLLAALFVTGCMAPEGEGLLRTVDGSGAKVNFDVYAKPLPDIPLPNDFATRFDATSPTQKRINASMMAATKWEQATRATLDRLEGWGTYQTITVSFDKPLDLHNLISRHQGDDYDPSNDAAYLINITKGPEFCERTPLDLGEGNFPIVLERQGYFDNDRLGEQLLFDDREEDANGNGVLDLGEDLDMDGVLDHPNTLNPGDSPFDVLTFYEKETNTLLLKPVLPLREKTTYAVVLTKRLTDAEGAPVQSPFAYINHAAQTKALGTLEECLPKFGLALEDVAFTWPYTTQSVTDDYIAVRDGLYGKGPMSRLATSYPATFKRRLLRDDEVSNPWLVTSADFKAAAMPALTTLAGGSLSPSEQEVLNSHEQYVDFHAVFQFQAPQFFPRTDREGKLLKLYEQLIDIDPVSGAAFERAETITAWVVVPKLRPANGPAPVVILGHGYGSSKLEALFFAGFLARYGVATVVIENVSHGLNLSQVEMEAAQGIFDSGKIGGMFRAIAKEGRAFDQNNDERNDSGADFWTAYILHTREVVKQSALDYMQLVRILRSFDGVNRTDFDGDRDGVMDLAGDLDGDGVVDIGGNAPISIMGGSLGGIMSAMMAGLEPHIDVAVPVAGGAGLPDIGVRSIQGGVREAVNLRMLGPLFVTVPNNEGTLEAFELVPNLAGLGRIKLGPVSATLNEGDTAVLFNLTTGEHRCARVEAGGRLRAAISSDQGDRWKLAVFAGPLPPKERDGCEVPGGHKPYWELDTFQEEVEFQGVKYRAGTPLLAVGDGFGLRRQSPELRRFLGLAQLAIDKADPVNFLPFASQQRELKYAEGPQVGTRLLVVNTIGDMNVPVATGVALARAAGLIELEEKDERYGKTPNRVLIDTKVIEAVERVGHYQNSLGQDVLMDVDHFSAMSGSGEQDLFDVPRLNPPLRLHKPGGKVGGTVGVIFPMVTPTGRHGFDTPDPSLPFNLGAVMLNMLGRYMATNGEELHFDGCLESSSCEWTPQPP